jgi:hypothetical protein
VRFLLITLAALAAAVAANFIVGAALGDGAGVGLARLGAAGIAAVLVIAAGQRMRDAPGAERQDLDVRPVPTGVREAESAPRASPFVLTASGHDPGALALLTAAALKTRVRPDQAAAGMEAGGRDVRTATNASAHVPGGIGTP